MTAAASRLGWPDLCKGLGIFLVTLGHSALVDDGVVAWIYTFHMPLFFFLSGYFFTLWEDSPWKTIRHKAFPILAPMVTYSLCRWVWAAVGSLAAGEAVDFAPLLGIVVQLPGTPFAGYVWFFAGLFSGQCIFALLLKGLGKQPWLLTGLCFVLAGGVWLAAEAGMPRLPWSIDAGCLLLPYLALGWLLRQKESELDQALSGWGKWGGTVFLLLILQIVSMEINLSLGPTRMDYNLRLLNEYFSAYLAGTSGVLWFWLACRKLPAPRCLTFVGEYSAVYYCVGWIGSNIAHLLLVPVLHISGLALLMVHLLGMWVVPVPLILVLRRFAPVLIGKRG